MAKKTVEDIMLESFGESGTKLDMTGDEYIGYVTGVCLISNPTAGYRLADYLNAARKLYNEGRL